jgi:hypothetical protein
MSCRMPAHGKAVAVVYKEKHPRWWLQSFLGGVATLVLGARNHTGQLLKVRTASGSWILQSVDHCVSCSAGCHP